MSVRIRIPQESRPCTDFRCFEFTDIRYVHQLIICFLLNHAFIRRVYTPFADILARDPLTPVVDRKAQISLHGRDRDMPLREQTRFGIGLRIS